MPVFPLIALFLGLGTESIVFPEPVPFEQVWPRAWEALGMVVAIGVISLAISSVAIFRLRRPGKVAPTVRLLLSIGPRVVDLLTLVGYAWVILCLQWPEVVRSGLGLRDVVLVDDVLILLPFVMAQLAAWTGFYPADRILRAIRVGEDQPPIGLVRHLILKARRSLGMSLSAYLVIALGQDLARVAWPSSAETPEFQIATMAVMGAVILAFAPAFVRLSWPTYPMPVGPLRDRLERLSRRFGFRCTDILIWETDDTIVNAGVTGALPFYRYVVLTDALVACMNEHETAAVFGHEVGHVRHRHLGFFGVFVVGSMGLLALANDLISGHVVKALGSFGGATVSELVQGGVLLTLGLAYFGLTFGLISRRFERQADVFGCRAVSCDRVDCPPHPDLYGHSGAVPASGPICPVGIRTFVNGLAKVAALNRVEPTARSWRHGSIARRIAFLEGLEGKPDAERRFQTGTARLRAALVIGLIAALITAFQTGAIAHLGP